MPGSNTGRAIGTVGGAVFGGPIGGAIGNALGGIVGGLFSHQASSATLQRTYDSMPAWVREVISGPEFSALESNRQAGFFANDVARAVDGMTTPESIASYRQWSAGNYRPEVQAVTTKILDRKLETITGIANSPANTAMPQAGAQTMGIIPGVGSNQPINTPLGKIPGWAIALIVLALIGVVFYFLRSR